MVTKLDELSNVQANAGPPAPHQRTANAIKKVNNRVRMSAPLALSLLFRNATITGFARLIVKQGLQVSA